MPTGGLLMPGIVLYPTEYRCQANDRKIGAWKEENGEEKSAPKQSEAHERRGEILNVGKKTGWSNRQFHPDRFITVSGYR
jgi:hypothetical protein